MVTSSQSILEAIKGRRDASIDFAGIYDDGETANVRNVWQAHPSDAGKLALLDAVTARIVAKDSQPYRKQHPDWAHNFMHDKVAVADDTVITGSSTSRPTRRATPRTGSRSRTRRSPTPTCTTSTRSWIATASPLRCAPGGRPRRRPAAGRTRRVPCQARRAPDQQSVNGSACAVLMH